MYGLKKTFFKPVFLTNHNCSFNLKFSMDCSFFSRSAMNNSQLFSTSGSITLVGRAHMSS